MPDFPLDLYTATFGEDSYATTLRPDETAGGSPVWVLSVLVAGRIWRWATEDVDIDTDGGTTLHIPGGAHLEVDQKADVLQLDGTEQAVSVENLLPPEDVSALVEAGHEIDDTPAEIALWYPGRTWENRIVALRGSTWLPSYGAQDEPLALTVESPEYQERGRLIEPSGVVSSVTWSSTTKPGDRVDGRVYPLVIGRPDWVPAIVYDTVNNKMVIAQGLVAATQVAIVVDDGNGTSTTSDAGTVTQVRDSLGQWAATTVYTGFVAPGVFDDAEYVSRWMSGYANDGGLNSDRGSGALTGLGDVARWAMRKSTIPTDEGRWRALEDRLNRFLIDFWTNDVELTPWQFVRDDLLPLAPVSILHGPRGLYPVWWPYDAEGGASLVAAVVDVQTSGLQRAGLVEHERRDRPVNEVTLEYYPWQGDLWRYRLTYTGSEILQDATSDTQLVQTSPLRAAVARHRGERRAAPLMQSRCVYQRATAEMVLGWRQYAVSRTPRVVTYDDEAGRFAWLETGTVVQLVDDELGIDRLAWVSRRAWSVDAVRLSFMLWDH